MKTSLLGSLLAWRALGHGSLVMPPTWHDADGRYSMQAGMQCQAGCTGRSSTGAAEGCSCEYYSNWTHIPGEHTIPRNSPLRTYMDWTFPGVKLYDWTTKNPWRAPGTAPIFSPCGVDGGNPWGCPVGNPTPYGCQGGGYGLGPDARARYVDFPRPPTTKWEAGSVVEAAWGIVANHGGGYSYRLCRRPASLMSLTEDCFQKTVLNFVGDTQWAQFGKETTKRIAFKALRTTEGTYPKGSMWTRNPIPACESPAGRSCGTGPWGNQSGGGVQFTPPFSYGYGFGSHTHGKEGPFKWNIVDKLQVPADLPSGDYVLSWRWDAEQTPQVWNTCSNVEIIQSVLV